MSTAPAYPLVADVNLSAHILVTLVALGMALAFIVADRESATSRALAVALASIGISIDLNVVMLLQWNLPLSATRWFAAADSVAMIALLEWILRVRRTVPAGDLDTRPGDRVLRAGQLAALAYWLLAVARPDWRAYDFLGGLGDPDRWTKPGFWLFAGLTLFVVLAALGSILLLLNRRPDRAEKVRVLAMAAAIPFLALSLVLPLEHFPIAIVVGLMLFLLGAVQYHVLQGQRGQFMSRFLSPQVAKLVSERGLRSAMQENQLEITVVCCDLRGFTPYAQAQPSSTVLKVLREYYDAVGAVVAEFGGTIKDYAGDGILMLVGAPLPLVDHAAKGLEMTCRLRVAIREVTERWSQPAHRLGVGIGAASGRVTVGVIGSASRLEYTAVGPAVNLASRLCEQARDGEILVDGRTVELAGGARVEARQALAVKGFAEPVVHFAVPIAEPTA